MRTQHLKRLAKKNYDHQFSKLPQDDKSLFRESLDNMIRVFQTYPDFGLAYSMWINVVMEELNGRGR